MLGLYDFVQGAVDEDKMVTKAVIHSDNDDQIEIEYIDNENGKGVVTNVKKKGATDMANLAWETEFAKAEYNEKSPFEIREAHTKFVADIEKKYEGKSVWGFPVQFNPATIVMETSYKEESEEKKDKKPNAEQVVTSGDPGQNDNKTIATTDRKEAPVETKRTAHEGKKRVEVSMTLVFDELMYWDKLTKTGELDEDVRGSEAITASVYGGGGWGFVKNALGGGYDEALSHFNLLDDSSPYRLLELAFYTKEYVVFEWGPMKFRGQITKFSSTFTVFSPSGAPLRANVNFGLRLDTDNADLKNGKTGIDFKKEYKESEWLDNRASKTATIKSVGNLMKSFLL